MDICIPKAPNSLIAGPGTKLVGPALTSISSGAICPAFAEEGVFSLDKIPANSNPSISEITKAEFS